MNIVCAYDNKEEKEISKRQRVGEERGRERERERERERKSREEREPM